MNEQIITDNLIKDSKKYFNEIINIYNLFRLDEEITKEFEELLSKNGFDSEEIINSKKNIDEISSDDSHSNIDTIRSQIKSINELNKEIDDRIDDSTHTIKDIIADIKKIK